ncbi:hypothetical protein LTR47_009935 [Exophiala xenobiotica]|nr:hypothetical protein LTR47_009935 [Exophiala xenobiotica]KAK5284257.1 hypothetical protein LTR40_000535 [Exophiala xenobiotica]KAK5359190.1 hypothetical protein LTR11_010618 [Exophiala xenobiotica]
MSGPTYEKAEVTPPSSFHNPPSPPPTDEKVARDRPSIWQKIAILRSGRATQALHKVDRSEWNVVQEWLQRDDKIQYFRLPLALTEQVITSKHRFDYFPSSERLFQRMPTKVHELFSRSLSGRISEQLRFISSKSGPAADFAKDVRDVGSATIRARDPDYGSHDPDSSFQHLRSPLPTVIIEPAHSQNGRVLRHLAEEYILGSDLVIRVVVGVDIEYSKSKRAVFSVWRAKEQSSGADKVWVVESTVTNQVFRSGDGKPNTDKTLGLQLHLEDFADEKTCRCFKNLDRDIYVSCDEMYQYLEEAEAVMKVAESIRQEPNLRLKKRRRTQTPEEQLDDGDEDAYAQAEEHVSKRRDMEDESFKGSSSE